MDGSAKKLVSSRGGLKYESLNGQCKNPFMLTEPEWLEDGKALECVCGQKFNTLNRRHHCRRCGLIFCSKCCGTKVSLFRMQFVDPVRQCYKCADISLRETEFFDRHLKLLKIGGNFLIRAGQESEFESLIRISGCLQWLMFEGIAGQPAQPVHVSSISRIELSPISSAKCSKFGGMAHVSSADVRYSVGSGSENSLNLHIRDIPTRSHNSEWLRALHRGLQMLQESKLN